MPVAVGASATSAASVGFASVILAAVVASAGGFVAVWRLSIWRAVIRDLRIGQLKVDELVCGMPDHAADRWRLSTSSGRGLSGPRQDRSAAGVEAAARVISGRRL